MKAELSDQSPRPLAGRTGAKVANHSTHDRLLITAKEAAGRLGISDRTLWDYTNRGAIPCVRIGRLVKYRPHELIAWLDAGAPTEPGSAMRVQMGAQR